jgi:imidazolonepropionase-like amidohydrolase
MAWAVLAGAFSVTALGQTATLIRGANVVDGTGAPARRADVLLRGERIEAVGEGLTAPAGAQIVEAAGYTLAPGLFDLHTHLLASAVGSSEADWGKVLKAYLVCGVTSVVDLSTYSEQFEPMRRLVKNGLPAPRLHLASRFSSPGGHGLEGGRGDFHTQEVLTPEQARTAVKRVLPFRPDVLKVFTDGWRYGVDADMTSMEEETLRAIVEESHKAGIRVVTHTVTVEKARVAARAGVDAIIHGMGDQRADDALFQLMKEKGTAYVQTLAVYEPGKQVGPEDPVLERAMEPALRKQLRVSTRPPDAARVRRWANLMENGGLARKAGVLLGAGTDAGVTGAYHGWATLRELELLVKTGMSPLEAITAATGNSARILGVEAERGTVQPGKLADLLLVRGSPQEDVREMANVERVWLGGREQDLGALKNEIASPAWTRLPGVKAPAVLDDFSATDGRSRLRTLWINNTDGGHDHARMIYQRTERRPGDGALLAVTELMEKPQRYGASYGAMVLPLTPGGVEPADVSGWSGVEFEARGAGRQRLQLRLSGTRGGRPSQSFAVNSRWTKVRVPFRALQRGGAPFAWSGQMVTAIEFVMTGPAGSKAWLELDNVRLYR